MQKLGDFIEQNKDVLKTLINNGIVSPDKLNAFQMYKDFNAIEGCHKAEKERIIAKRNKVSTKTVERAVSLMNRKI